MKYKLQIYGESPRSEVRSPKSGIEGMSFCTCFWEEMWYICNMKIKVCSYFICFFFPILGRAQIRTSRIVIESQGISVQHGCNIRDRFNGESGSSDTISAFFRMDINAIIFLDSSNIFSYSLIDTQYRTPLDSGQDRINETDLRISIDSKNTLSVYANQSSLVHYGREDYPFHWDQNGSSLSIKNIPFSVSQLKDSLFVQLDSSYLESFFKEDSLLINDYSRYSTASRIGSCGSGTPVAITDKSYLNILILGNFPLSVYRYNDAEKKIILDPLSKTLKLYSQSSNQSQPLPCFDLLGRKHNLEFLSSDGETSTYSLRSLPAGVYFVSNGREMVKFLVGE
jgi:hypothetical protein